MLGSKFDKDHTYFMCRLPIHPQAKPPVGLSGQEGGRSVTAPVEASVEAPVDIYATDRAILVTLVSRECGRSDLLKMLGHKQRSGNFKKSIEKLLRGNLIERTIPDKPNRRLQKYRLTAKGRAVSAPHSEYFVHSVKNSAQAR